MRTMPTVRADDGGNLILPDAFLQRLFISPDTESWLKGWEGDSILHPCLPDLRGLYTEPTTNCNRNRWEDPEPKMCTGTGCRSMSVRWQCKSG
jgi:hypothetical protein